MNYTRIYASHISWKKPTVPLPNERNPRVAFDRLFRAKPKRAGVGGDDDLSVLDLVWDEARKLRRSLGKQDQQKLEEYLESVREVERRIEHEANQLGSGQNLAPDMIKNIEISFIVNTTEGAQAIADSAEIRRAALQHTVGVPQHRIH